MTFPVGEIQEIRLFRTVDFAKKLKNVEPSVGSRRSSLHTRGETRPAKPVF